MLSRLYGIGGSTTLAKMSDTLKFPWCLPVDYTHAFPLNVFKRLWSHIQGTFYDFTEDGIDSDGVAGNTRPTAEFEAAPDTRPTDSPPSSSGSSTRSSAYSMARPPSTLNGDVDGRESTLEASSNHRPRESQGPMTPVPAVRVHGNIRNESSHDTDHDQELDSDDHGADDHGGNIIIDSQESIPEELEAVASVQSAGGRGSEDGDDDDSGSDMDDRQVRSSII